MNFRFFSGPFRQHAAGWGRATNPFSQASRAVAGWIFIVGLLLVGFGVIIIALPEIFALLAAVVFFIAGVSCLVIAVKIFLAQRKLDKINYEYSKEERKNVQIHIDEYYDI